MNNKKNIVVMSAICLSLGAVASFSFIGKDNSLKLNAKSGETLLTPDELTVSEVLHTQSNCCESFSFRFATTLVIRNNLYGQVGLSVHDSSFVESDQTSHSSETDIPHFEGIVSQVYGIGTAQEDNGHNGRSLIVIPRGINVTNNYIIDPTTIRTGSVKESLQYADAFGIFIPKEVLNIEAGAIVNVPSNVTIYCEADEGSYEAGWTDAQNIEYSVDPVENYKNLFAQSFGYDDSLTEKEEIESLLHKNLFMRRTNGKTEIPTGYKLSLGYVGTVSYNVMEGETLIPVSETYNEPLKVSYDVNRKNGETETITRELELTNNRLHYDSVGIGEDSIDISFDVELADGESVANNSFVFSNIYNIGRAPAYKDDGTVDENAPYIPYVDKEHYIARPVSLVNTMVKLNDITKFSPTGFETFGDFTQFSFDVTNTAKAAYRKFDSKTYNDYASLIEDGSYYIRLRFVNLFNTSLDVKLKGSDEIHNVKIDTPLDYDYVIIGSKSTNNRVGFLFRNSDICENFDANKVEEIAIRHLSLKLEIVKNDGASTNAAKNILATFGLVRVFDQKNENKVVDLTLIMILSVVGYVALFLTGAVILYFILKEKFKNDEFRRINTKEYVVSSLKNFLGFAIVVVSILFIVFRVALLNTAIVVYNPLDPFVIGFTIVAGIFIGFSIKNLVVAIKRTIDNKKKAKLNLDKDVVEDGSK